MKLYLISLEKSNILFEIYKKSLEKINFFYKKYWQTENDKILYFQFRKTKQRKRWYKVAFDYSKLKGKIKERGLTQEAVAEYVGIDKATFSLKLNNLSLFTQKEILKICEILNISPEDINTYFFQQEFK